MAAQEPWTQQQPETGDDDRWHVMIAPGEVKVLTLEQLDDLFRLEIIDENTSVRQSHMSGWLPLGVVAGLEAEPADPSGAVPPPVPNRAALPPAAVAPSTGHAPPGRSLPPPPVTRGAPPAPRLVATVPPSPAQVAAAFAAPAPSMRPPAAFAPPAQAWPAAGGTSPTQAALFAPVPTVQVASETLRPMASESDIVFRSSRGSSGGSWLIAFAVVLGAGVTLYRNGVVRDVARSSGQEAIYGRLEAAVGGPSFGTPRAVEQLDVTAPAGPARAAPVSATHGMDSEAAAPKANAPTAPSHTVRLEDLEPEKAGAARAAGSKPIALDALPQPASEQPTAPTPKHAPAAVVPLHGAASSHAAASSQVAPSHPGAVKRRAKDASRMYDPLNPDL